MIFAQRLCACLADLLQNRALSLDMLPLSDRNATPEVEQAHYWLRAAAAFATDMKEQGYDAALEAMRRQISGMTTVVNTSQFLPSLCERAARGRAVPPNLVDAIRTMSKVSGNKSQALTLARCAAAIGEVTTACDLWGSSVS